MAYRCGRFYAVVVCKGVETVFLCKGRLYLFWFGESVSWAKFHQASGQAFTAALRLYKATFISDQHFSILLLQLFSRFCKHGTKWFLSTSTSRVGCTTLHTESTIIAHNLSPRPPANNKSIFSFCRHLRSGIRKETTIPSFNSRPQF